jgi:hypothetical protein
VWALLSDRVKLLAYRILDPATKAKTKSEPVHHLTPAPG